MLRAISGSVRTTARVARRTAVAATRFVRRNPLLVALLVVAVVVGALWLRTCRREGWKFESGSKGKTSKKWEEKAYEYCLAGKSFDDLMNDNTMKAMRKFDEDRIRGSCEAGIKDRGGSSGGGSSGGGGGGSSNVGTCSAGYVSNGKDCVPLEFRSEDFGGSGGSYKDLNCPTGYIKTIKAWYDNGKNEIKNLSIRCSDGTIMDKGEGTKWKDVKEWTDPHGKGWTKIGYVTDFSEKSGNRVRAIGPAWDEMLGTTWESDRHKAFDCNSKEAPSGKRYVMTGMGVSSGDGIDRINVRCSLKDK